MAELRIISCSLIATDPVARPLEACDIRTRQAYTRAATDARELMIPRVNREGMPIDLFREPGPALSAFGRCIPGVCCRFGTLQELSRVGGEIASRSPRGHHRAARCWGLNSNHRNILAGRVTEHHFRQERDAEIGGNQILDGLGLFALEGHFGLKSRSGNIAELSRGYCAPEFCIR